MVATAVLPRALRVVAWLHLLMGVGSAAEILVGLTRHSIHFAFGVLGIPIYFGLLRLSSGWRTCALVMLWLDLIALPVAFYISLMGSGPVPFRVLGVDVGEVPRVWMTVTALTAFPLIVWQYLVLVRADVRQLFFPATMPSEPVAAAYDR